MSVQQPDNRDWHCVLGLDNCERVVSGSHASLCEAVGRAADLRVYTEFFFEEHIAPDLPEPERSGHDGLIQEVIDFRQTFLVDGRHAAGVTTTRQPMFPLRGFNGVEPRLSLFMYNMTGHQSCATLPLGCDLKAVHATGRHEVTPGPADMPKMSRVESFDVGSHCTSRNFTYHMETYRFWVQDTWRQVLSHDDSGHILSGDWDDLREAHITGREIKVAIAGACNDLGSGPEAELFTSLGSGFVHTGKDIYEAQTHPMVRVATGIPLVYQPGGWDVSWFIIRTDGTASCRSLEPRSLRYRDWQSRFACRWFVR